MDKSKNYQDLDRYQDVLGQLPMLQVYAHILYLFPMPETVTREEIIRELEKAITMVREKVPWMGARVINVGKKPGNSGLYRVIQCPPPKKGIEVKDRSSTLPSYAQIKERKAPISMLDSKLLTPVPAFPELFEDSEEDPAYVVRLQASFIEGGVILDFVKQHNMADAGGHFGFVRLMSMAMRGEAFPDSLLEQVNRDRRDLFQLLGPDEPMLDHSHHRRPHVSASTPIVKSDPARYHIFRFTKSKMNQLKELASQREGFHPDVSYISTDDALSAFCWKRFTTARMHRLQKPDIISRFSRAIDARKTLGISADYMGDLIHNVTTWLSFKDLNEAPLSTIASHMRKQLNKTNNAYNVRSFATFIAREPDKSTITYGGQFNFDTDVGCSSVLRRTDLFPVFGNLGRPDFIRRPTFPDAPFPGLLIFFPGNVNGDCDALTCLADKDFDALNVDPEWNQYVEYID
jgi:trichothecene 3-O-acetyltransferase